MPTPRRPTACSYALVTDYTTTILYDITTPSDPQQVFEVPGWMLRLVQLR